MNTGSLTQNAYFSFSGSEFFYFTVYFAYRQKASNCS